MALCDFTVHVRKAGDQRIWRGVDEHSRPSGGGASETAPEAERNAVALADKHTRFRRVTKGGW